MSLPAVYHNPVPTLGPEYLHNGHERNTVKMNGRQVFRFATQAVADSIMETVAKADPSILDLPVTILEHFGIAKPSQMVGSSIFAT